MPIVFGESLPKASQSSTPVLPNVERRTRPRFAMLAHPHQWEWDADIKRWLPRLTKLKHDPGVQGVSYDDIHKILDTSEAENFYRRKGYLIMDNGDARLHGCSVLEDGEFMVRLRAGRGYAYCWVWEGFEKVGNSIVWEENAKVRRAVQEYLLDQGILPGMNPRLKDVEIGRLQARVRRLAEKVSDNSSPSLRLRLKAAENLLADWVKDKNPTPAKSTKSTKED